jgi:hypothetical protein
MRSDRQSAPDHVGTVGGDDGHALFRAAFKRIAATASGSISAASTLAAPSFAQAMAARPQPAAKSSTRLPRAISG